jgi:hypothetical protein
MPAGRPRLTDKQRYESAVNRFWSKVTKSSPCWLWKGSTRSDGYGALSYNHYLDNKLRRNVSAHRFAYCLANHWELKNIGKLVIMHTCDTPLCVTPTHLKLGTTLDNNMDKLLKGRSGFKNFLLPEHVLYIRNCNLTAIELADKYGVTPNYIRQIRRGIKWKQLIEV